MESENVDYQKMWEELKDAVERSYEANKEESFKNHNYAIRADALHGIKTIMSAIVIKQQSK